MKSKKGKEMLTFTDWYYQESKIMQSILDTQGIEIDAVRDKLKDILNQFYVDTATWGLRFMGKRAKYNKILAVIMLKEEIV